MDKIKKVEVYYQEYIGSKTDKVTMLPPKLIDSFHSISTAKRAIEILGNFTHTVNMIVEERMDWETIHKEVPCLVRHQIGFEHDKWGYDFEVFEKGVFKSLPSDKYLSFRVFYKVIR